MTLPKKVEIPRDVLVTKYDCDFTDSDCINDCITDYLSDNYDYCVNGYEDWKIDGSSVWVSNIEWDDDYLDYIDELEELNLNDTDYEYYANIIHDMHFGDTMSSKFDGTVYESYNAVLEDARKNAPKIIKVTMYMEVEKDFVEDAKRWTRHIEELIDVDEYPEIKSIYNVKVEAVD